MARKRLSWKTYSRDLAREHLDQGDWVVVRVLDDSDASAEWTRRLAEEPVRDLLARFTLLETDADTAGRWTLPEIPGLVVLDKSGAPLPKGALGASSVVDAEDLLQFLTDKEPLLAFQTASDDSMGFLPLETADFETLCNRRKKPAVVYFVDDSKAAAEWRAWFREWNFADTASKYPSLLGDLTTTRDADRLRQLIADWAVTEIPAVVVLDRDGQPTGPPLSAKDVGYYMDIYAFLLEERRKVGPQRRG